MREASSLGTERREAQPVGPIHTDPVHQGRSLVFGFSGGGRRRWRNSMETQRSIQRPALVFIPVMATVTFPEIGCDTRETLIHFEGIAEETAPVGVRAGTDELGGLEFVQWRENTARFEPSRCDSFVLRSFPWPSTPEVDPLLARRTRSPLEL